MLITLISCFEEKQGIEFAIAGSNFYHISTRPRIYFYFINETKLTVPPVGLISYVVIKASTTVDGSVL